MPEDYPDDPENLDRPPSFFPYEPDGPEQREGGFGEPVEVQVEAVYAAQTGSEIHRFIVLTDGVRKMSMVIGVCEARAITLPLDGTQPDRPMTHDLLYTIVERLGGTVDRVVIDDLWGSTYYAKLYIKAGKDQYELDSRPSDAIALAVRAQCPILVADGILNHAAQ